MNNITMRDIKCNNAKQIYELRNMLFERSNDPLFRYQLRNNGTLCFVCCVIMIVGILGNTLNIASILHSKIKKLHGFDGNFRRIGVFILNLSLIEVKNHQIDGFYCNLGQTTLILALTISRFSRLIFSWEIYSQPISRFLVSREKMRCLVVRFGKI